MDKGTFDYFSEIVDRIYDKLEDSFCLTISEEEINDLREKLDQFSDKLDKLESLNCLLTDVHNEIVDIQQYLANNKPLKEEEEEEVAGLQKVDIPRPSSTSSTDSTTSSTDSAEAPRYEKLPFTFLRSISNSAYNRYYTAYKEAKTILKKFNEKDKEDIFILAEKRIQTPAPDAKTLYANLQEVFEAFDTIELTKKYGKEFIRFHKIFKRMLHLAKTYAIKQK